MFKRRRRKTNRGEKMIYLLEILSSFEPNALFQKRVAATVARAKKEAVRAWDPESSGATAAVG